MNRRDFVKSCGVAAASVAAARVLAQNQTTAAGQAASAIVIDPKPLFEISPHLYLQFMEPLGVTDSSVEAAWDYNRDDWRKDFVETTADLAPGMMRFGGLFSRYYKWREGIGPPAKRPWMRNYVAVHMMGQTPVRKDTVLRGFKYQAEPERAWAELMEMIGVRIEQKLLALEESLASRNSKMPIAITEGHLSLAPHNSNPILTEW